MTIYRIEKYNKKRNCWILLYSSHNIDLVNEVLKSHLREHQKIYLRLNTIFVPE